MSKRLFVSLCVCACTAGGIYGQIKNPCAIVRTGRLLGIGVPEVVTRACEASRAVQIPAARPNAARGTVGLPPEMVPQPGGAPASVPPPSSQLPAAAAPQATGAAQTVGDFTYRALVRPGDVIDGRTISNIHPQLALNDQGEIAFTANWTAGNVTHHGIFTSHHAVNDDVINPGFTPYDGMQNQIQMNNRGDVVYEAYLLNGALDGIWKNREIVFNAKQVHDARPKVDPEVANRDTILRHLDDDMITGIVSPASPRITSSGQVSFAFNGFVYTVKPDGGVAQQTGRTISNHQVTVSSFDRNDSGEIVFTNTWIVRPGIPFVLRAAQQAGLFTRSKLLYDLNTSSLGQMPSFVTPRINNKGQIAYLNIADEVANGEPQFAIYIDGAAASWRSTPSKGFSYQIGFNDRGGLLISEGPRSYPVLYRGNQATPVVTDELANNAPFWVNFTGKPLPPNSVFTCVMNNQDEVACSIAGANTIILATPVAR